MSMVLLAVGSRNNPLQQPTVFQGNCRYRRVQYANLGNQRALPYKSLKILAKQQKFKTKRKKEHTKKYNESKKEK
jgi:hypothetical protein